MRKVLPKVVQCCLVPKKQTKPSKNSSIFTLYRVYYLCKILNNKHSLIIIVRYSLPEAGYTWEADVTKKEREMYDILRDNPSITQTELSRLMNITRSSASVHISNLVKKGFIKGRGYILSEPGYVVVIGAANIDILGRSKAALIQQDSNPGKIEMCAGGVGRNIAENLARIGIPSKMISTIGNDVFGDKIIEMSTLAGVDMTQCFIKPEAATSTYIAIIDNDGEMDIALSDMAILDEMPREYLMRKRSTIANAQTIVLDAGLKADTIEYILANHSSSKMYVDPVSVGKSEHIKDYLGEFNTIKCNRLEASHLSGIDIVDENTLRHAGEFFLKKGTKRVFISLSKDGLYYCTKSEEGTCPTIPVKPVNATGAGDALMAGIVYGSLKRYSTHEIATIGNAMARIALASISTVSDLLSFETLQKELAKQ